MRIRTIKPEFFTHEALFDAEKETGLPIRVAFAGLWCAADKEGRFKWEPRRLGVSILPYDGVDFSRVLDACLTRGFVVKYRVGDVWFGAIPSWKKHQFVNNKETQSSIPDISVSDELDASVTREARETHAFHKEGKGKEGKDPPAENPAGGGEIPAVPISQSAKTQDPPKPPPPKTEADPRHHEITSRWGEQFRAFHEITYTIEGQDLSALKRFLKTTGDTSDQILAVAGKAWSRAKRDRFIRHCKEAITIRGLCSAYNQIRVELQTAEPLNTGNGVQTLSFETALAKAKFAGGFGK